MRYSPLPVTGTGTALALGLSGHQTIAIGLFMVVVGIMLFKVVRFKVKDN